MIAPRVQFCSRHADTFAYDPLEGGGVLGPVCEQMLTMSHVTRARLSRKEDKVKSLLQEEEYLRRYLRQEFASIRKEAETFAKSLQTFNRFNMAREPATRHRICIHCAQPISALYREYSKGNIRLEQCGSMVCNKTRFADHYIENDPVVVFIDMILLKRPVFRHLIHNRLKYSPNSGVNNTVLKLALILILFEVYVKWFKLEKYHGSSDFMGVGEDGSLHVQYFWILGLCILESLIWHGTIRSATWLLHTPKMLHEASHADQTSSSEPEPRDIRWYNSLSMALIISSYGKLFLLLMAIWDYKELDYAWLLNVFVLVSNLEALSAYLHSGYVVTAGILLIGVAARVAVNAFWWWSGVNGVLFI